MAKAMDDIHKKVLRKYHTLCSNAGLSATDKEAILSSRGVESSADLDTHDLIDICNHLEKQIGGKDYQMNTLRKRAMAAIGGYLSLTKQQSSCEIIKAIACRATGYSNFNRIPAERLRNLYNTFRNQQKDINSAQAVAISIAMQGVTNNERQITN